MSKKAKVLTDADIKLVLAVIASKPLAPRNRAIFMTGLYAGLRAIELANLTVGAVVDSQGKVLDRLSFNKNQTKGNQRRTVPVSDTLSKELQKYVATLPARMLAQPERPFFPSQKGGGFTPHGIVMILQRIYRTANIVGASSHSTRRTLATRLSERAVNVHVLQQILGHADIRTTSGYVDVGEHQIINAVNLL